jgi:hypothetical protein
MKKKCTRKRRPDIRLQLIVVKIIFLKRFAAGEIPEGSLRMMEEFDPDFNRHYIDLGGYCEKLVDAEVTKMIYRMSIRQPPPPMNP